MGSGISPEEKKVKEAYRLNSTEKKIKLNLGCGVKVANGWINIDNSPGIFLSKHPTLKKALYKMGLIPKGVYLTIWPKDILHHDLRRGIPFSDNSVDYIYTSHSLQYFTVPEAVKLLKECQRTLKPEGWIRIVVPDLKIFASKYMNGDMEFFSAKTKAELNKKFLERLQVGQRKRLIEYIRPSLVPKRFYDFESLSSLLQTCGFVNIYRRNFKTGVVPDIDVLDYKPDESLHVEAQKPGRVPPPR